MTSVYRTVVLCSKNLYAPQKKVIATPPDVVVTCNSAVQYDI